MILAAFLLAAAATPTPAPQPDGALDRQCFALMASVAEADDPRLRSVGLVAAQYFLGRIDSRSGGVLADPVAQAPLPAGEARRTLVGRCARVIEEAGHDFQSIGAQLAEAAPSA